MNEVTEQQIWDKLKKVYDPETNISVVDMGLIYKIKISNIKDQKSNSRVKVFILMTLTSSGCPLASVFDDLIGGPIRRMKEVKECNIEVTFDPPWNMGMMSKDARAELGYF